MAAATARDPELITVREMLTNGTRFGEFPYWTKIKHQLTTETLEQQFIVLKGDLVVIPKTMRQEVLGMAHDTHMGIGKMTAFLRSVA